MQLSSVYLYEKIKEKYEITERGTLSSSDGYLRRPAHNAMAVRKLKISN